MNVLELLNLEQTDGSAATPAHEDLFERDASRNPLSFGDEDHFHSNVAKLLYFLTTRVSCPTDEDKCKLDRVMKYLNSTWDLGITLSGEGDLRVVAYVDASYAVHGDY
jgi:hypothetical protein